MLIIEFVTSGYRPFNGKISMTSGISVIDHEIHALNRVKFISPGKNLCVRVVSATNFSCSRACSSKSKLVNRIEMIRRLCNR